MNENYDNILEGFGSEAMEQADNEAMTIHVVCQQGGQSATMEVYDYNTKESVLRAALEAMGLETLIKQADYYPVLMNAREQTSVADDTPIADFVRDGEKLRINCFGGVA